MRRAKSDWKAMTTMNSLKLNSTQSGPLVQSEGPRRAERVVQQLGYAPRADEVARLIETCIDARLTGDVDEARMSATLIGVRSRDLSAESGYAILLDALAAGGAVERSLALLGALYEPTDVIELRALNPGGAGAFSLNGRLGHPDERDRMAAFIGEHNGHRNLYFGINPRGAAMAGTTRAANQSDIVSRSHVVLDLDNKDAPAADPGWTRTVKALKSLDPTMVNASGNGWHIWLRLQMLQGSDLPASVQPLADAMKMIGADNMADLPRIIRLPWTINIPTKSKRNRPGNPATLELARVVFGPNDQAMHWDVAGISAAISRVAADRGIERATASVAEGVGSGKSALPQELRWAPSRDLLSAALALIPNGDGISREEQVDLALAVRGASTQTHFEADARSAFLDWSSRWTLGGDPDHDERLYDTIRSSHTGWPHLLAMLGRLNPAGLAQIEDMERPLRNAAARAAFADASTEQFAALGISGEPGVGGPEDAPIEVADGKVGVATRAMQKLLRPGHAEFFSSPDGKLWVRLMGRVSRIDESKGSRAVLAWLVRQGIILSGTAKNDLKDQMIARATAGPIHEVHYRQATVADRTPSRAFLNLMDGGNGVEISLKGWSVRPLSTLPVRMTDRERALPLPNPVRANDGVSFFERLERHVRLFPVRNANDSLDRGVQQRAALLMVLVAQIFRPGAVPHLLLTGPQGASKTTTARRIKSLVDPDAADVVTTFPDKASEIFAIAEQQTLIVTDNVSGVRHPDLLAALATGAATQQRELYSDGGRVVYRATASVVMTTVLGEITRRPDLVDRILRVDLPALDRRDRRTEDELNEAWKRDLPHLLADLLDIMSGGMSRLEMVRKCVEAGLLPPLPRLADAALIAEAAAQAAGWGPGVLLAAINAMREGDAARQLEENPLASRIREMLDAEGGTWTGTTQELITRLRLLDGPEWGHAGNGVQAFTNALDRVAGPLREVWGVVVERTRTHGTRRLTLSRVRH